MEGLSIWIDRGVGNLTFSFPEGRGLFHSSNLEELPISSNFQQLSFLLENLATIPFKACNKITSPVHVTIVFLVVDVTKSFASEVML